MIFIAQIRHLRSHIHIKPTLHRSINMNWFSTPSKKSNQKFIASIDQGTSSTRFMVFDKSGTTIAVSQKEHKQFYPQQGYVEHDAQEIWSNVKSCVTDALSKANLSANNIVSLGITNQRETTVIWDKTTGQCLPLFDLSFSIVVVAIKIILTHLYSTHSYTRLSLLCAPSLTMIHSLHLPPPQGLPYAKAIVWNDTRTTTFCESLKQRGLEAKIKAKTGLPLSCYFSASKIRYLIDHNESIRQGIEKVSSLFIVTVLCVYNHDDCSTHSTPLCSPYHGSIAILYGNRMVSLFPFPLPTIWPISHHLAYLSPFQGNALFGTIDTWLLWKLTQGACHHTDVTNASRTLLYNIQELQWDAELLDIFK